jgi:pimeloyl-ACP methyl ester carboxylesterase
MAGNERCLVRISAHILSLFSALFIWSNAALADGPKRPLIFVPGILGSQLCDGSENVLWGHADSLLNLPKLAILSSGPRADIHSCGIITQIQVLGPLWSLHEYDDLLKSLTQIGYQSGKTLFVFDYDWRLSNFDNAKRLDAFIEKTIAAGVHVDILAHSMGGLITRIYLKQAASPASRVNEVFYMGTPFLGSANTFGAMSSGWGFLLSKLAGGMDTIRSTVLSLPGFVELLPRYSKCCYVRDGAGHQQYQSIFDVSTWKSLGWLPSKNWTAADTNTFASNLQRASTLDSVVRGPAGEGIREVMVVGTNHATHYYLGMLASATHPDGWKFTDTGGDGTVPTWSAANRPSLDSIAGTYVSFAEHGTIFDDLSVREEMLREFTSPTPPKQFAISGSGEPTLSVKGTTTRWTIHQLGLTTNEATVAKGGTISGDVVIQFDPQDQILKGAYMPHSSISDSSGKRALILEEVTSGDDLLRNQLHYVFSGEKAENLGIADIGIELGQISSHAYVVVMQ